MLHVLKKRAPKRAGQEHTVEWQPTLLNPDVLVMIEPNDADPENESLVYIKGRTPIIVGHALHELEGMIHNWRAR